MILINLILLGESTVSNIIKETCQVISTTIKPLHMPQINTEECWHKIAHQSYFKWNIPNRIGVVTVNMLQFLSEKFGVFIF